MPRDTTGRDQDTVRDLHESAVVSIPDHMPKPENIWVTEEAHTS